MESNFKEHLSYHVINNSKNFNEILFMHQLNSLYYNLYDVEKDFELFLIIEKLFQKAKELSFAKSKDEGVIARATRRPGVGAVVSTINRSEDFSSSMQR